MPQLALAEFDGLPAYVVALDAQGRIAFWNRHLEEVTGIGREAMLGLLGHDVLPSGVPAPLATASGPPRLVRWLRSTEPLPGGWTFAVGYDVTEEYAAFEQTLRTERLAAVGRLVSGFAHEVRNPLNAAVLQMSLCERRIERNDLRAEGLLEPLRKTRAELYRVERLVSDFLAFAQPKPLSMAPLDLVDLIKSVMGQTQMPAGVTMAIDAPRPVRIQGDSARLSTAVLNLIENALEAMPAGGTITLRARAQAKAAELEVEDTGIGVIDPKHVFDPFYSTKAAGTGMGLTIVHRIVADHGGQVRLHTKAGSTCFTIALPLAMR